MKHDAAQNHIGRHYSLITGLIGLTLLVFHPMCRAEATDLPVMRISVENTDEHVQTRSVRAFADALAERLKGRLDVRFHSGASLFRDQDVITALSQGKVEMAVPGTWQIDRFEPNAGIFLLPLFYGKSGAVNHAVMDGPVGRLIQERIAQSLGLKVIGRWIDLGHAHLFGVRSTIHRHEDIAGMRIRVAGGTANAMRIEAMGGIPRVIPWPDLRAKMGQGLIDGMLTTHETVVSARLWEAGIQSAFEDRQYFAQYVPLVGAHFWNRIGPEIQAVLAGTWEEHVDQGRNAAALAQTGARDILKAHGVSLITPAPEATALWRSRILAAQPEMIAGMQIDAGLFSQVQDAVHQIEATGRK